MFSGCTALESVDFTGADFTAVAGADWMFNSCPNLTSITLGEDFSFEGAGSERIIDLPVPSAPGCTGMWVCKETGEVFSSEEIPSGVAGTYVAQRNFTDELSIDLSPVTYTGSPITKSITTDLVEGVDYAVSYANNTNAGTATVTVTGLGDYFNYVSTYTFQINQAMPEYTAPEAVDALYGQTLGELALPAGFGWQEPSALVGDPGANVFYVTYMPSDANHAVVTDIPVTVNVAATDAYFDYVVNVDDGSLSLGITLDYLADVTWDVSDPTIASIGNVSTNIVNFPGYQSVSVGVTVLLNAPGDVEVYAYANGSLVSTTTVRVKPSNRIDLSSADISGLDASYTYTGSVIEPAPVVTLNGEVLSAGADYVVSYGNNMMPGSATVTVEGIGGYRGQVSTGFEIVPASLSSAAVTVPGSPFTYTGSPIEPEVTVQVGDATLVRDSDYTVSYANNTEVGTATVTVEGTGGYKDTAVATFEISEAGEPEQPGGTDEPQIVFADVTDETPHAEDIRWLAANGISTGWDNGDGTYHFSGMSTVVRQDMAAFLHRLAGLAGSSLRETLTLSFSDVTDETPHADDIRWLAATGVSQGWKDEGKDTYHFSGMSGVTRQDMAAFLYRLAGSPDYEPTAEDKARFTDVDDATPHAKEIWWLAANGISTGWDDGNGKAHFSGMSTVVRQDMAAFLHRLYEKGLIK